MEDSPSLQRYHRTRARVDLLNRLTYKPECKGIWLNILEISDHYVIKLELSVKCSDSGEPIRTHYSQEYTKEVYEALTEKELLAEIRRIIILTETHEVDEWLKLDGIKIFDPHSTPSPESR